VLPVKVVVSAPVIVSSNVPGIGVGVAVGTGVDVAVAVAVLVAVAVAVAVAVEVAVAVAVGVGVGPPQLPFTFNTMCMFGNPIAAVSVGVVIPHVAALM